MVTFENRPTRANLSPLINDVLIAKMKGAEKVILIDEDKTNYIFLLGFSRLQAKNYYQNIYTIYFQIMSLMKKR